MKEIRLEINIDVSKNDISPITVAQIIERAIIERLEGNGPNPRHPYITLQSVKIV